MVRNILAAIVGFAFIGVLVVCTDQLFSFAIDGFDAMDPRPTFYYAISLVTTTIWDMIGAWTCSILAKDGAGKAGRLLGMGGEVLLLIATVMLWKKVPHYYTIGLLATYPLAILFGTRSYQWTRPDPEEEKLIRKRAIR